MKHRNERQTESEMDLSKVQDRQYERTQHLKKGQRESDREREREIYIYMDGAWLGMRKNVKNATAATAKNQDAGLPAVQNPNAHFWAERVRSSRTLAKL